MMQHQGTWIANQAAGQRSPVPILQWAWPACPAKMSVYDKYSDKEVTLYLSDALWVIWTRGAVETLRFTDDEVGQLQRKLVFLTQASNAPSTLAMFSRFVVNHWNIYERLLVGGPVSARSIWNSEVIDVTVAKAGKMLLNLACKLGLGGWSALHKALVRSLDTRAKVPLLVQRGKLKRREKLLTISTQAEIVAVLDEASASARLDDAVVEGLAALALFFQHGMRPVQLLALRLEHLPAPVQDASGDLALLVSYHGAKRGENPRELLRQVKPEWVPLVDKLRQQAQNAKRSRVFSCTSNADLWAMVKAASRAHGLVIDFKAYGLRHSGAQSLADVGQDRKSIKEFLGHGTINAATTYLRASRNQADLINRALGASKLYEKILAFTTDSFIDVQELLEAPEDQQVGGVVGQSLIAGIGLCKTGQSSCAFNPVTSCYGCSRFMPAVDVAAHQEAVVGMRQQVQVYLEDGSSKTSPAYMQLRTALSSAQQAVELSTQIARSKQ